MAKSPAFQFYPNDWLSSPAVTLMTPDQEGAYIRLLCYDWASDGIPDDDAALAQLSRMGEGWLKGGSTVVKGCFNQHPTKPGFLTNLRLQIERKKQDNWRSKSSEGGKKSASKRLNIKTSSRVVEPSVNRPVEPKVNSSSSFSSSSSSSTSVIAEREHSGREDSTRVIPSRDAVLNHARTIGLAEWKALDWFDEMEGCGWKDHQGRDVMRWQAVIARVKTKWEADGRPMAPATRQNAPGRSGAYVGAGNSPKIAPTPQSAHAAGFFSDELLQKIKGDQK